MVATLVGVANDAEKYQDYNHFESALVDRVDDQRHLKSLEHKSDGDTSNLLFLQSSTCLCWGLGPHGLADVPKALVQHPEWDKYPQHVKEDQVDPHVQKV